MPSNTSSPINEAVGTTGGDRFSNEVGTNFSKQIMEGASTFIWQTFRQGEGIGRTSTRCLPSARLTNQLPRLGCGTNLPSARLTEPAAQTRLCSQSPLSSVNEPAAQIRLWNQSSLSSVNGTSSGLGYGTSLPSARLTEPAPDLVMEPVSPQLG
ncbi:hypothetical protein CKAN_00521200 [Cinnamomum micranthum f. kanehirae]|uniref:Uncharacterized protein n=1 Tax=Cinnamomum micranthum f. kanehirae TaxID=337451 RepID=A0A443NE15_9MAGN|nr:hypothetical protein CKAN_00521200 [Cinnamomum micranthum f. kanehirae]